MQVTTKKESMAILARTFKTIQSFTIRFENEKVKLLKLISIGWPKDEILEVLLNTKGLNTTFIVYALRYFMANNVI